MASIKVLHEVTGCIFKQGDEKPTMKWSFLTKIELEGNWCFEIQTEVAVQAVNARSGIPTWKNIFDRY